MDIDRYLAKNQATWARLEDLTGRARRPKDLRPEELAELVDLYQVAGSQLSAARTRYDDPILTAHLTRLVASAHSVIYGTRPRTWRSLARFFTHTFPAAVWRSRWFVVAAIVLTFAPALAVGTWIANSDRALEASAPDAVREAYVAEDFEAYYKSEPAAQFATEVFINNIQVAIYAFAAGILVCGVSAFILAFNGANVGVAAGLFAAAGQSAKFWGLILPHGLIELSAVVVAGAAGLRLGWTVIDPGDRTRADALADEGRRSVVLVFGVMIALAVAGAIEGFVTGSSLPTIVRIMIGILAATAFWLWVVVQGRIAVADGATGLLSDEDRRIRTHPARASARAAAPVTAGG